MMKLVKLLVLFSLIPLVSCQTTAPSVYFGRPKVIPTINSNCTGFRDGDTIDATNFISTSPEEYDELLEYFDDKERRLYICLKYPRKCK